MDWRQQQSFAMDVTEGRPTHGKNLIVCSPPTKGLPVGSGDQLELHLADPLIARAQNVRQALPVGR